MKHLSEKEQRAIQHEISYAESRHNEASEELLKYMKHVSTWEDRVSHWEKTLFELKARAAKHG